MTVTTSTALRCDHDRCPGKRMLDPADLLVSLAAAARAGWSVARLGGGRAGRDYCPRHRQPSRRR